MRDLLSEVQAALYCAGTNFRKWYRNPTIIVLALVWLAYTYHACHGLTDFCVDNGYYIHPWVLPFYTDNTHANFMYICMLMLLFAQAPFCDATVPFTMIRTGKRAWFLGQVLYIAGASLVFLLFHYGAMLLVLAPALGFSPNWGGVIEGLAKNSSLMQEYDTTLLEFNPQLINDYGPWEATWKTMLLLWLTSMFVGYLILFFNAMVKPGVGIIVTGGMACWTKFAGSVHGMLTYGAWISKTALFYWGSLSGLYPMRSGSVPAETAVPIQLGIIAVCIVVSTVVFSRKDTVFEKGRF